MLEDDEHAQVLVRGEAMVCAGLDEDGAALTDRYLLAFDLEDACALENDVDLVVFVRLLPVGLWGNQDIDTELETSGFVNDLVASAAFAQTLLGGADLERVHGATLLHARLACGFPAGRLRRTLMRRR